MIDSLNLKDETATAILALAIDFETYTDEMPETEKDRLEASHEMVTLAIDAWKDDGIRSDSDDPDTAEAGASVEALLKVAGVSIDDDGDLTYGKALTGAKLDKVLSGYGLELADEEDDDDEDEDEDEAAATDDEAAFSVEDIIEGYDELTPASKIKAIKGLKLDAEDDDDLTVLNNLADYEEAQDKPTSRVLSYLEELIGTEDDEADEEEAEEEEETEAVADSDDDDDEETEPWDAESLAELEKAELKEVADEYGVDFPKRMTETGKARTIAAILEVQGEDEGEETEAAADDDEEPFEGYDESKVSEIKSLLTEAANDEEEPLAVGQVQAVIDYEEANSNRAPLIKWLGALLEEIEESEEEEAEEEEAPAAKTKPAKKKKSATVTEGDFDPDDTDIEDMLPKGMARTFVMSQMKQAESQLQAHGLVAPSEYEGEFPELPEDIDATDYSELSNTMLAFQNAHATATWQKSYHYIMANTMEEIAEYMEAIALHDAEGANEPARKAAARTDEQVVFFRARWKEHYNSYVRFRDLSFTIEGKIKAVSRVLGFKDSEEESADLTPKNGRSKRTPVGMKKASSRRARVK